VVHTNKGAGHYLETELATIGNHLLLLATTWQWLRSSRRPQPAVGVHHSSPPPGTAGCSWWGAERAPEAGSHQTLERTGPTPATRAAALKKGEKCIVLISFVSSVAEMQ